MHIPKHYEESEASVLQALIRSNPLGAWVTQVDGALEVNHVPFLVYADRGEWGTLVGHVAKANPVWSSFSTEVDSVVVFQGAQAYVTPSWYPSKREHGKVVPTWNYEVVHAYGTPCAIEDPEWLRAHVQEQTEVREAGQAVPWKLADAPSDFVEKMVGAIVGIEIPIARLLGKWKVSQNKQTSDRLGVVAGLLGSDDAPSREMAALVERHIDR